LDGVALANLSDILDVNESAVGGADREIVQSGDLSRAAVEFDYELPVTEPGRACGEDEVLLIDGQRYVGCGEMFRLEQVGIGVDHDLADLATVRERDGCAFDGRETGPDEAEAEIVEILFTEALAAQGELHDGNTGRVVFENGRREGAGRENAEDGLNDGGDLGDGELDLDGGLEVDANDGDAL